MTERLYGEVVTPFLVARQQLCDAALNWALAEDDRSILGTRRREDANSRLQRAAEDYAEASLRVGLAERAK